MSDLEPYQPDRALPWDGARAAFLLRRTGFAAAPEEIERALRDGPRATVDRLIDDTEESERAHELEALGSRLALGRNIEPLRAWWLLRMRHTAQPLRARLAVFWHDHFATSNLKVGAPALMLRQLRTIETHGLGHFRDLVVAMSRDPAMIVWLDGEDNVKGRPNENFARELLELFTLGLGAYDEHDVRESARAFTGWRVRRGRTEFVARRHDDAVKTVLGRTDLRSGDDVIDAALAQPAAARFLADKLVREFVSGHAEDALVDALAAHLRETDFDIASALRTALASRAMHDPRHARTRIKSPVEFVVGLARSLEADAPGPELADATSRLGQRLFEPPSVEGWKGGRAWLDSTTMLMRLNTVDAALAPERFDAARFTAQLGDAGDREALLTRLGALTLDGAVPDALRRPLAKLDGPPATRSRDALRILLSAPEYQLS